MLMFSGRYLLMARLEKSRRSQMKCGMNFQFHCMISNSPPNLLLRPGSSPADLRDLMRDSITQELYSCMRTSSPDKLFKRRTRLSFPCISMALQSTAGAARCLVATAGEQQSLNLQLNIKGRINSYYVMSFIQTGTGGGQGQLHEGEMEWVIAAKAVKPSASTCDINIIIIIIIIKPLSF